MIGCERGRTGVLLAPPHLRSARVVVNDPPTRRRPAKNQAEAAGGIAAALFCPCEMEPPQHKRGLGSDQPDLDLTKLQLPHGFCVLITLAVALQHVLPSARNPASS